MSNEAAMEDRLSALPESLILQILSLLETREAVQTSLLSKYWKHLWTNVPCLEVIEEKNAVVAVGTLIDKVLRHHRWRGTKIQKFKINLSSSPSSEQMDSWLEFATEKKVESLGVALPFDRVISPQKNNPPGYRLPECVYSCSSITWLVLVGFSLSSLLDGGNLQVQWYNLRTLHLEGMSFSEDVINQVVSSATQLVDLDLRLYGCDHNLTIRSSTLKILSVVKYNLWSRVYDSSRYTKLTIWAPKLEYLRIEGNAYGKCLLMDDASLLTQVRLHFYELWDVPLSDTLMQILPKIQQHVEVLALSPCSFKMLGVMLMLKGGKYSFSSPFSNVKKLLFYGAIKPNEIVGLAELFPKVELLQINWKFDKWYPLFLTNLWENNVVDHDKAIKNLESFWMQLKRVEFTWHSYEDISMMMMFKLIDFLLKHATLTVQEIVIRKGGSADVDAEARFRLMCTLKIFPTKDLSITFSHSKITIKISKV